MKIHTETATGRVKTGSEAKRDLNDKIGFNIVAYQGDKVSFHVGPYHVEISRSELARLSDFNWKA